MRQADHLRLPQGTGMRHAATCPASPPTTHLQLQQHLLRRVSVRDDAAHRLLQPREQAGGVHQLPVQPLDHLGGHLARHVQDGGPGGRGAGMDGVVLVLVVHGGRESTEEEDTLATALQLHYRARCGWV